MNKYIKLELDKCNFWQTEEENGKRIFKRKDFVRKSDNDLNVVFFKRNGIFDSFSEVTSGKKLSLLNRGKRIIVLEPLGITVTRGAFSPSSLGEVKRTIESIKNNDKAGEYLSILKDLLENSDLCERANLIKTSDDKKIKLNRKKNK